ncbi:MAG TPA: type 1 glutamine amidotransferase [Burkholderiaceae bacterium]|nr:type 1 glutamine amidotransferase [Burkholderiaceae bacterium]
MRPVAILQHAVDVEPGFFETWLDRCAIRSRKFEPYRGEAVPADPRAFSGVCLMGGPMSANDPLPWLEDEIRLVRAADAAGVPVIGHCLGGQLLAKAFGAPVTRHSVKEIGWGEVHVTDAAVAARWFGDEALRSIEMFQWHGDTFALPPQANNFLASSLCARQAYVIERAGYAHLGMQFHCEMTPDLIRAWTDDPTWLEEVEIERRVNGGPGVQDAEQMLERVEERCSVMNRVAARLYARWSDGLVR